MKEASSHIPSSLFPISLEELIRFYHCSNLRGTRGGGSTPPRGPAAAPAAAAAAAAATVNLKQLLHPLLSIQQLQQLGRTKHRRGIRLSVWRKLRKLPAASISTEAAAGHSLSAVPAADDSEDFEAGLSITPGHLSLSNRDDNRHVLSDSSVHKWWQWHTFSSRNININHNIVKNSC